MKGKTEDPHNQVFGFGSEALQFLRGQHAFECVHQRRERDGEPDVVEQPAEILQGVGNALEKMSFAFVKAAKAISAEGLQDANVNVGVKVTQECFAIQLDKTCETVEIVIEKLLTEVGREIGLGIVQQ